MLNRPRPDSKPVEVDQAVQRARGHSYAWVNNNRRKGNKYHSAKAKNDWISMVIMNNTFDLIKSDPGNNYKYMEYMTNWQCSMLPMSIRYAELFFLLKPLLETIYWFNGLKVKLSKSNILLVVMVKVFPA